MEYRRSVLTASTISRSLRSTVRSWVRNAFLTYCWVMVEAPSVPLPVTLETTARPIPTTEIPGWEK